MKNLKEEIERLSKAEVKDIEVTKKGMEFWGSDRLLGTYDRSSGAITIYEGQE